MAQFTNQAQLSYNNTVVNSNVVVGQFGGLFLQGCVIKCGTNVNL